MPPLPPQAPAQQLAPSLVPLRLVTVIFSWVSAPVRFLKPALTAAPAPLRASVHPPTSATSATQQAGSASATIQRGAPQRAPTRVQPHHLPHATTSFERVGPALPTHPIPTDAITARTGPRFTVWQTARLGVHGDNRISYTFMMPRSGVSAKTPGQLPAHRTWWSRALGGYSRTPIGLSACTSRPTPTTYTTAIATPTTWTASSR